MFWLPTSVRVGCSGPCPPQSKNLYFTRPSRPKRDHTLVTQRPERVDIWDILVGHLYLKICQYTRNGMQSCI